MMETPAAYKPLVPPPKRMSDASSPLNSAEVRARPEPGSVISVHGQLFLPTLRLGTNFRVIPPLLTAKKILLPREN